MRMDHLVSLSEFVILRLRNLTHFAQTAHLWKVMDVENMQFFRNHNATFVVIKLIIWATFMTKKARAKDDGDV